VPQGGSFAAIMQGTGITLAQVSFAGRTSRAVPDGGGWLALVGAGQRIGLTEQHAPGTYPVVAQLGMADGTTRTLAGEVTVTATRFPVEAIFLAPTEAALLDPALTQRELAILRPLYDGFTPRRLWDGFFVRPSTGPITDVFGSRRSYNGGPAVGSHSGVDFGADAGAPVVAAATGRVVYAGPLPVRGTTVVIDHGAGVFTGYCHLSAILVAAEQDVRAGEEIAKVGASGLATGPHLHWEVAVGGYHVNGLLWLAA
jgi:murein DD-endopeptidase MepM/ murein hydrolase activator NlpD